MLNLTSAAAAAASTALRTAGWSCLVFFLFLPTLLRKLHGDGCCTAPSQKSRIRPRYDYETKHVSLDSKMCCCCCRFCCGAPTTGERIHAPVLHDASQIDYDVAPHYHQLLVFCRVCRFQARVWEFYRTSRSFGYGHGSVTELTEVPGIVALAYRTHRSSGRVHKMLYPYRGNCGTGRT